MLAWSPCIRTANTQAVDLLVLKSEVKLLMCRIVESIGYGLQWCHGKQAEVRCVPRAYRQNSINLLEVTVMHPRHLQPGIVNICMWVLVYAAITHVYKINKSLFFFFLAKNASTEEAVQIFKDKNPQRKQKNCFISPFCSWINALRQLPNVWVRLVCL